MGNGWLDRVTARAERSRLRVRGVSLPLLALHVGRRFMDVRVLGLSAEMTYYAILSVFPLIGALGAGLSFVQRIAGPEAAAEAEGTVLNALEAIFAADIIREVFSPMVQGMLQGERAAFALGSFLLALFLGSRIFRSTIHTLDVAYDVEERRGPVALWSLGLVYAMGAIVVFMVVLSLLVVGPLLGGARWVAERTAIGDEMGLLWEIVRWPMVFVVATFFLAAVYRFGPNVRNRWRQTLPGAAFGVIGLVAVTLGFRLYLGVVGIDAPAIAEADAAVRFAAQVIGAGLATLLWMWLTSIVVLTGGVLNAEVARLRHEPIVARE